MIQVSTILPQVESFVPFVFYPGSADSKELYSEPPYLNILRCARIHQDSSDWVEFFKLCVSAHFATVASFVPTDLDDLVRMKLWRSAASFEQRDKVCEFILESRFWDITPVSRRWVKGPFSALILSGHQGEWFSIAAGAYAANLKRNKPKAQALFEAILASWQTHSEIFEEFLRSGDGIGILKAATIVAHNLGDLNRVIDQWCLPDSDPLKLCVYDLEKSTQDGSSQRRKILKKACDLNRQFMAIENHRHFALRKPRCLRKEVDFLLPIGPFFDDWGRQIARHPGLSFPDLAEIILALIEGWEQLEGPVGYARSLAGLQEGLPGGFESLGFYLPARALRKLKSGPIRSLCSIPQDRFERIWESRGQNHRKKEPVDKLNMFNFSS